MSRSIGAVVAGVVMVVGLTILVDAALHAAHVFPSAAQSLSGRLAALALTYRVVIGVFGAALTALLAPSKPMTHAIVLGVIGTLAATAGVVTTWNLNLGPHWYPIAIAVFAIPQSCAGGALALRTRASMRST